MTEAKQMIMSVLLSPDETTAVDVLVMLGAFLVVGVATLWWFFGIRGKRRRKRKHRHHFHKSRVRRAESMSLPPLRQPEDKPGSPPEV